MTAVEQPELHFLKGYDIVGEDGASSIPCGAPRGEIILNHPLVKLLGFNGQNVFCAG